MIKRDNENIKNNPYGINDVEYAEIVKKQNKKDNIFVEEV